MLRCVISVATYAAQPHSHECPSPPIQSPALWSASRLPLRAAVRCPPRKRRLRVGARYKDNRPARFHHPFRASLRKIERPVELDIHHACPIRRRQTDTVMRLAHASTVHHAVNLSKLFDRRFRRRLTLLRIRNVANNPVLRNPTHIQNRRSSRARPPTPVAHSLRRRFRPHHPKPQSLCLASSSP